MHARFDFSDSILVITGGGNGIGRALAEAAAQAGGRVVILDLDQTAMDEAAAKSPLISSRRVDVSDRAAVFDAFAAIEREFGRIDGLVCGAAIQPRTAVHDMPAEEWTRVLRINLDGVVWCYQAVITGMIARRRGAIVAFSSGLG